MNNGFFQNQSTVNAVNHRHKKTKSRLTLFDNTQLNGSGGVADIHRSRESAGRSKRQFDTVNFIATRYRIDNRMSHTYSKMYPARSRGLLSCHKTKVEEANVDFRGFAHSVAVSGRGCRFGYRGLCRRFFSTWASIVEIWSRSETFTHGFLVAPISLWLIWSRRHCYRNLQPESAWLGLLVTAIGGFVWLVAKLVHVLVLEQWAVVTILIGGYWGLLGGSVIKKMLFPILFLYLMVPFGEAFIPWMMEYTASFVVWMIRLTGMSVYRDGMFFMLTSGSWSVVEGCSGLRYLIASLTLGLVYAYLNFRNLRKRTLFIIASFLTPILANGLRAYMIVMIGHFSGMKLAVGVDHIIYGWLFFGLVMLLLFYAGSFWADQETIVDTSSEQSMPEPMTRYQGLLPMIAVVVIGLIAWPIVFRSLAARQAVAAAIPDQIVTLRGSGGCSIAARLGMAANFQWRHGGGNKRG
ncbi:exosortase A [Methylomonas sp. CM2]|uniref:exosortase A n=1 Tax=Methylomonas sp. CM2 TaxID=3417647 RepID=UPI003CF4EE8B